MCQMSAEFRRRKKRERQKRKRKAQRRRKSGGHEARSLPTFPRMSESLEVIAEPLLLEVSGEWSSQAVEGVFRLAALAWNTSIEASEKVTSLCATLPEDLRQAVQMMIERKKALYGNDRRIVLGVRTVRTESGFHTQALSAFDA